MSASPHGPIHTLDAEIRRAREAERSAEERGASFGMIDPIRYRIAKLERERECLGGAEKANA